MVLPIEKNVEVRKGDTFTFSFSIKDRNNGVDVIRNLTGYTAAGMVKASPESSSATVATMSFTSSAGDLTNGIITLKIAWAVTAAMATGSYYFDIYVVDTASEKQTYYKGKFNLVDRLTV